MSPADLEELILKGDSMGIADGLSGIDEAQRRKLSKTASSLAKAAEEYQWQSWRWRNGQPPPSHLRVHESVTKGKIDICKINDAAFTATLGVCPMSAWKQRSRLRYQDCEHAARVLLDRRPEFLDDYLEYEFISDSDSGGIGWAAFWKLRTHSVCRKPSSDAYYRYFARSLVSEEIGALAVYLADKPELLDDVWELFRVETNAFAWGWQVWTEAIIRLQHRGLLDRVRLLRASVEALLNPWKTSELSNLARLHEKLEPTPDELADLQPLYADLLASPQSQVASFGVKMLKAVESAGRLDAEHLASATAVFSLRTKGPAKGVILMLTRLAKKDAAQRETAASLLTEALVHEADDVQAAALKALMPMAKAAVKKKQEAPPWVESIRDRLPDLAATVRPAAEDLLALFGVEPPAAEVELAEEPEADLETVLAEAADLPEKWRQLAGLELSVLGEGAQYPTPMPFRIDQVPVLSGLEPITPIVSVDELIDAVAHAVEQVDGPDELERILDGISRLCNQRPEDFERRTEAILKRASDERWSESPRGITQVYHRNGVGLKRVILQWLRGPSDCLQDVVLPQGWRKARLSIFDFLDWRMYELIPRVRECIAAPLLSAPTHARGWIDPRVCVERWLTLQSLDLHPPRSDVIAALLRLAPEGRAEALEEARSISASDASAFRYALGSGDPADSPASRVAKDADEEGIGLWLAAGRCRSPRGRLDDLAAAGIDVPGPDGITPADYSADPQRRSETKKITETYSYTNVNLRASLSRGGDEAKGLHPAWPTRLLHRGGDGWVAAGTNAAWARRWATTVWPMNADPVLATVGTAMIRRLDSAGSTWEPNHAFLDPLFDIDRPWSDVACFAVAVGLAGRDQDVRGLCGDATIEAIEDGRFQPLPLAQWLARLGKGGLLKLNRITDAGAEIARVSDLHGWAVAELSAALVAELGELPRDVHHLLALLLEQLKRLDLPLPPSARPVLDSVTGSGKTAKLARSLLDHEGTPTSPALHRARTSAAAARLDRGRRWVGHAGGAGSDL